MLFFCASPASYAQSSIIGYSPPFLFNTVIGPMITAYSDLFVFNTQLEASRIVAYSNFFTFNTLEEEDRIIVYSDFFTFDTRGFEPGRIIAYSNLFRFDTRSEVNQIIVYSNLFTFDTRVVDGRLVGYSDYFSFNTLARASLVAYSEFFIFNTLPPEFLITVELSPAEGGSVTGAGYYEPDAEVTLEAIANEGYEFVNWTNEDDVQVSDEAVYTFIMPAENVSLTANFQNVVGIGELADFDISVFPNPANSKFFVESDRFINKIMLFDAGGQMVRSIDLNGLEAEIDISTLRSGIYFMQFHLPDHIVNKRVQIFR